MPRSCCSGAVRATVDRGVHAKSLARPAIRTVVVLFSCVVTNREPEKICFVWGDETLTFRLCFFYELRPPKRNAVLGHLDRGYAHLLDWVGLASALIDGFRLSRQCSCRAAA